MPVTSISKTKGEKGGITPCEPYLPYPILDGQTINAFVPLHIFKTASSQAGIQQGMLNLRRVF